MYKIVVLSVDSSTDDVNAFILNETFKSENIASENASRIKWHSDAILKSNEDVTDYFSDYFRYEFWLCKEDPFKKVILLNNNGNLIKKENEWTIDNNRLLSALVLHEDSMENVFKKLRREFSDELVDASIKKE